MVRFKRNIKNLSPLPLILALPLFLVLFASETTISKIQKLAILVLSVGLFVCL